MTDIGTPDDACHWAPIPVPLPAVGRTIGFEAAGKKLLLCNADGAPYVVDNLCPHVFVPLEGGTLRGTILQCPLHGGEIDVRDGSPAGKPIRKAVPCHPVREGPGGLEVGVRP